MFPELIKAACSMLGIKKLILTLIFRNKNNFYTLK